MSLQLLPSPYLVNNELSEKAKASKKGVRQVEVWRMSQWCLLHGYEDAESVKISSLKKVGIHQRYVRSVRTGTLPF